MHLTPVVLVGRVGGSAYGNCRVELNESVGIPSAGIAFMQPIMLQVSISDNKMTGKVEDGG